MKASIKVVGASGQISLGKEFAGRQVLVEQSEPGVWIVRTATVIPDNERWLNTPEVTVGLSRALVWAAGNPAQCLIRLNRSSSAAATSSPSITRAAAASPWKALSPRIAVT